MINIFKYIYFYQIDYLVELYLIHTYQINREGEKKIKSKREKKMKKEIKERIKSYGSKLLRDNKCNIIENIHNALENIQNTLVYLLLRVYVGMSNRLICSIPSRTATGSSSSGSWRVRPAWAAILKMADQTRNAEHVGLCGSARGT